MDISLRKGLMTELECQQAFIYLGYSVSVPLGNFDKYDMIADVECELFQLGADNPDNDDLKAAKDSARAALMSFARAIGKI